MNGAGAARGAQKKNTFRMVSPRDAALAALRDVNENGAYVSQALDRALAQAKLSDDDRRLCAALLYTCVENALRIEFALKKHAAKKPDPVVWGILSIAAAQLLYMERIPPHAAVNEAVEQAKRWKRGEQKGFVNACLRALIRDMEAGDPLLPDDSDSVLRDSVRYSYSVDAVRALTDAYGTEEARRIMAYVPPDRGRVTLRANASALPAGGLEGYLTRCGLQWEKASVEGCCFVRGMRDIEQTEGYRRGYFAVQGESSVLAAMACGCRPGMNVLDACAAPGGKTCLMAEAMQGTGRVYAWDIHETRTGLIRSAAKRMRLDNIRVMTHDARVPFPDFAGAMDAVLVDAPCTGLGVANEKPDIKNSLTKAKIDELAALQGRILDACSQYVREGGLLVYSTCSILPDENCSRAEAFLQGHPDFAPDGDTSFLPEKLRAHCSNGMIQILPHRDGMDGFFIARMRRKRAGR